MVFFSTDIDQKIGRFVFVFVNRKKTSNMTFNTKWNWSCS